MISFRLLGIAVCAVSLNAEVVKESFDIMPDTSKWQMEVSSENNAIWSIQDNHLTARAKPAKSGIILLKSVPTDNYIVQVDFKFLSDDNKHVGLIFRGSPPKGRHQLYFTGFIFNIYENRAVLQMVDPTWRRIKEVKLNTTINNEWHTIKVEVVDESIKCFLDGVEIISEASGKLETGVPGLRVASGCAAAFRNFKLEIKE